MSQQFETKTEETSENSTENSTESTDTSIPALEVVEIPWEAASETFNLRNTLFEAQRHLSNTLLEQERSKRALLDRIDGLERAMYDSAARIQQDFPVNPDWHYEFKLPQVQGEKAYFIRKEEKN